MTDKLINTLELHLRNIPVTIVSQGAEALVFETTIHPYNTTIASPTSTPTTTKYIIKYRPSKPYRHPKIDAAINKSRTISETKFMYKLQKLNINCPSVILVDFNNAIIWMEYLGFTLPNDTISSLKNWLWYLEKQDDHIACVSDQVKSVCNRVGELIGKLHINDMIHGDLTSSNIILLPQDYEPALIDFGLSSFSGLAEDKAVDLYVLERAILSTHSLFSDTYNAWLLEGYKSIYTKLNKQSKYNEVEKKLLDVRLRGRKRSMLG